MWSFSSRKIKFLDGVEVRVANVTFCPTYAGWLMGLPDEERLKKTVQEAIRFSWRYDLPETVKPPIHLHMGKGKPVRGPHPDREYFEWSPTMVMVEFNGPPMLEEEDQTDGSYARVVWLTDSDGEEGIFTLIQRLVVEAELKWEDVQYPYWF